jgi:hypothetical protein
MAFVEIDDAGEFVLNEAGEKNVIDEVSTASWEDVQSHIPEEFKDEKMWENVKDTPTLLKNYAHAQKKMGSSLSIPDENSTPEEINEFYGKLGRPETAEDYGVEFPELPEGNYWDDDAKNGFLNAAHTAGLNQTQVEQILGWYGDYSMDVNLKGDQAIQNTTVELKKHWGERFDGNIALTQRAVAKLGGVELQAVLDETGLGNHPDLIRAFHRAGKLMEEHGYVQGEVHGVSNRDSAKAEIARVMADKDHPYWKGQAEAMEKVQKLHELAYGD